MNLHVLPPVSAQASDFIVLGLISFAAIANCFAAWSLHRSVSRMEGRDSFWKRWRGE